MKTIVMTGATAGIGLVAAQQMLDGGHRLLVGARSRSRLGDSRPLDLTRLASARELAGDAERWLGTSPLDVLVLNAGMQVANIRERTEDGLEPTFAANHLSHYLILRRLAPRLAPGATVVITTSDLHDPKTNAIAPPEHADATLLARGQGRRDPEARDLLAVMRAYSASKLCNVMTVRAFASSDLARERGVRVIAFNPGLTPGTQLLRHHALPMRLMVGGLLPLLSPLLRLNTVTGGGTLLADLALGRIVPPAGAIFASQSRRQLTWPDPAALARDEEAVAKLWRDSAAMVGLPALGVDAPVMR